MKRINRFTAFMLSAAMVLTNMGTANLSVKAAVPETDLTAVSILSGTPTDSKDASRGTGTSYDGYIQTNTELDADYLKVTYTVSDQSMVEAEDCVFNLQPFTSSWGGWQSNFVTIGNSSEENGVYTAYVSMDEIVASLGAELYGVNISYVEHEEVSYTLTGYEACIDNTKTDNEPGTEPGTGDGNEEDGTITASQQYVLNMGQGWNLGNSMDGVNTGLDEEDLGETAWGNPVVTKELIDEVAEKGYDSIRIPMTLYRRYSNVDGQYVIDESWLARYKQIVDWAVEDGLYVMINIHHDSWLWLSDWDGDTSSEEYVKFTQLWNQLAAYFAEEPEQVCFETINEPTFSATGTMSAQDKLDQINQAAYNAIRTSGGNNATRMIVMPTLDTNHGNGSALYQLITELNDPNIIATVHYYSEWVYSANLGKTGFDEVLWDADYTPRKAADTAMSTVYNDFTKNGIGVVIGEYGLLGYDASEECNQPGEELKYYEYMNELARSYGICLMFWDNGSGIDRTTFDWKKPLVGEMLEASMSGRSSYATGLDSIYFMEEAQEDILIPLTLNGNTFVGIEGLTEGTDYLYDEESATVTIKASYVNQCFAAMGTEYGTIADLVFTFSAGANWHEYLIKYAAPVIGEATGTVADGISIPVTFNGAKVRRITAYQTSGKVGPNSSWWNYLQYDGAFSVDYKEGNIQFNNTFFTDSTVKDGIIKMNVEFYDGQFAYIWMSKEGDVITCSKDVEVDLSEVSISNVICLYAGETEIPSQYIHMPEGGSVYGTWTADSSIVSMIGWPATMIFDTKAHEDFADGGVVLYYMDVENYVNVRFGIKDAPVVEKTEVGIGESSTVLVTNLAEDANVTYSVADSAIAAITEDGTVTGKKEGTTTVTVTVTQYNRTDSFTGTVEVKGLELAEIESQTYTGKAIKPAVVVTTGNLTLTAGKDYKVMYRKNVNAGTAQVTVIGRGIYEGLTLEGSFVIQAKSIEESDTIYRVIRKTYLTGVKGKVDLTTLLISNRKCLKEGKDYRVTMTDACGNAVKTIDKAGTYKVTATGMGNYTGSVSKIVKVTKNEVRIFGRVLAVYWNVTIQ